MIRLCAFSDEAAKDLKGQIAALLRNGIHFTELRSVGEKNVADLTLDEAREYASELSKNAISVWSIGSPLGKVDISVDIDEYLIKVEHVCKLANIFGAEKIRMFSFFGAYEKREKVIENLKRMVAVADKYGVVLCHENEKEIYGDTAERTLDILNSVPGLRSVYDPANFLQVGESADATLDALHARADYFHIKDVITETDELVPAGVGDGKIDELVRRITDDKVLTIEPHLTLFDAYKSIDNTEMKHKFEFSSSDEAFDAAVNAIKAILIAEGYKETNGGYAK